MRDILNSIPKNQCTVFTATISTVQYQRLMLKRVAVYDESGTKVIGHIGHCLVAKKPFKGLKVGDKVRFTGKPCKYTRSDNSQDYGIVVNKVSKIQG